MARCAEKRLCGSVAGYTLLPTMIGMIVILFLVSQALVFATGRQELTSVMYKANHTRLMTMMVPKERVRQIANEVGANQGIILGQVGQYCQTEAIGSDGTVLVDEEVVSLLSRAVSYILVVERYTIPSSNNEPQFDLWALPQYAYNYQSETIGQDQVSLVDSWVAFKDTAPKKGSADKDKEMRRLTDYDKVKKALETIWSEVEAQIEADKSGQTVDEEGNGDKLEDTEDKKQGVLGQGRVKTHLDILRKELDV